MKRPTWGRIFRGLRTKITLTVTFAVLACAVTISYVGYKTTSIDAHKHFESESGKEHFRVWSYVTQLIKTEPADRALADARAYVDNQYESAIFGDGITTTCTTGSCLDTLPRLDALPPIIRDVVNTSGEFSRYVHVAGISDETFVIVTNVDRPHDHPLSLVQAFTFHDYATDLGRLKRHLIELNIAGLGLALLVGFAVATGVRRPIRRVAVAAHRFGRGDLDVRAKVRGKDELGNLAASFNSMAGAMSTTVRDLEESQTLQRRFVADVSHELRTPLAAMLAAGDGLESVDPAARSRSAELLRDQTRRMARLVDDLLEMSRFDAGQSTLEPESTDLVELVRDAAHTIAPDADVQVSGIGDVTVVVDARRIHAVVRNLVANAMQHGEPPVDIVVDGGSDPVVLTVSDDGPGVAPELIDSMFDRFVRADSSRTSTVASTGLGLAIVRENVELHGGEVGITTAGRTTFWIRLPRTGPAR